MMGSRTKILPALGPGETYNDEDFLLVRTQTDVYGTSTTSIDRMLTAKRETDTGGWICKTISGDAKISHEAALEAALEFAAKHEIPIIYAEHFDERATQQFDWKSTSDTAELRPR
jgi:hypothetical protein